MTRLTVHHLGRPAGTTDELPILAIHGVRSHGRRFRRLAEEAWPDRSTLAVDLREHGDSTGDAEDVKATAAPG
jgi:pimeloyl-ACP methyl ester carboxylesterase